MHELKELFHKWLLMQTVMKMGWSGQQGQPQKCLDLIRLPCQLLIKTHHWLSVQPLNPSRRGRDTRGICDKSWAGVSAPFHSCGELLQRAFFSVCVDCHKEVKIQLIAVCPSYSGVLATWSSEFLSLGVCFLYSVNAAVSLKSLSLETSVTLGNS